MENSTCYPTSKKKPPRSIEKDIRPISLTPIVSKIFESIVMKWVDHILEDKIDDKLFGGGVGTSTTDALVEIRNQESGNVYLSQKYIVNIIQKHS